MEAHVGFHLIDKGQSMLGRLVKVRRPWRTIIERSIHLFPRTFYAGGGELKFWDPVSAPENRGVLLPAVWPRPLGTAARVMPEEPAMP